MDKHAKEGFILKGLGEYFEVFGRFYLTRQEYINVIV